MTETNAGQLDKEQFSRLVEASRVLNSTGDLDELLEFIVGEAAALTAAEAASILLLDRQTRQLHFRATSEQSHADLLDVPVPVDDSVAGTVFQTERSVIIDDVAGDERWNPDADEVVGFRTDSLLGVPMHDASAQVVGVLEALNKQVGAFDATDVETLSTLADLAGVAVERARIVAELRSANQQLNELDQLKSKFISIASHELRTPLSVILAYVSRLREQADSAETVSKLDQVLNAAVRLRSLIQDMLNLQYVDTGEPRLNLETFDIVQVVRAVVEERRDSAEARRQTITLQMPEEPLQVRADRGAMDVVIGNLLNNAIKFTPEGGKIRVLVQVQSQEVWLRVRDSGIGIPPDKLELIFNRFYQVEPHLRRSREGLGLGLAIARDLLEAQDGRIWARSESDAGSEFFIALPLVSEIDRGRKVKEA
jgi:signal transduction histidine kinase